MQSTEKLIEEMEEAISKVVNTCDTSDEDIVQLIRKSAEAVAVLRCIGDFDLKVMMYDMARIASAGGWVPDDFDVKAKPKKHG